MQSKGPQGQEPESLEERKFREETRLKKRELALKRIELFQARIQGNKGTTPTVVAALAGAFGVIIAALVQGSNSIAAEKQKDQSDLVLKAIDTKNDHKQALLNLGFFVDTGLLDDHDHKIRNQIAALNKRPQDGPVLSTAHDDSNGANLQSITIPPGAGFDITHNSPPESFNAARKAGLSFVWIKATQGDHFADAEFPTFAARAAAADLAIGAYHYFMPDVDATTQATRFLEAVQSAGGPSVFKLGAACDIEEGPEPSWDAIPAKEREDRIRTFLKIVDKAMGKPTWIYCYPSWWASEIQGDFSDHPLWAAGYGKEPSLEGTHWKKWNLWQYSTDGTIPGVGNGLDLDKQNNRN